MRWAALAALFLLPASAAAELGADGVWPDDGTDPVTVEIESASPFGLGDVAQAEPATANVRFYPAVGASADNPAPAVILLHGAGGVSRLREGRYAAEFSAQGVAVAVIDVFAARGSGDFVERLMKITETMALADAFATLDWLAARPDVDGSRVALIGFSYGAMSTMYSVRAQVTEAFGSPNRFAAHVAFYGPCIARFELPATTGAPIMMLWGERDEIIDGDRCEATAQGLRDAGSDVAVERYDAAHRWDGASRRWRAPAHIADCDLNVEADGTVRDSRTGFTMVDPASRALILGLCADREGFLIEPDEAVRQRSNAALAAFLNPVLFPGESPS